MDKDLIGFIGFITFLVMIGVVSYFVVRTISKRRAKREQEEQQAAIRRGIQQKEQAVFEIASDLQKELKKIESLKGSTTRTNHCKKALGLLKKTEDYSPVHKEVIENYDRLKERLETMPKVFPVIDYVEKAYKARFRGSNAQELNALTSALYAVQTGQVTNRDLIVSEIFPEGAFGEIIQIEDIVSRAKELGWEGPKDGSTLPM